MRALAALSLVATLAFAPTASMQEVGSDDVAAQSVLTGQVLIGPTCPVARSNPTPECVDRAYEASISVQPPDGSQELLRFDTDESGNFSVELSPGDYLLVPLTPPGQILPRGEPQLVSLDPGATASVTLHFDSGLR